MARVWMAMSGGVDSSVGAAVLLEEGHEVTGVTMQLWPEGDEEGSCCSVSAVRDARRVCDMLGIPHYTLNYRRTFEREVVRPFADAYAEGRTPNPCIVCNDRVKFSDLLAKVAAQGADFLATGHYAQIVRDEAGAPWLERGIDPGKDQSYFLYRLTRAQMEHVLFPVGGMHKPDVRAFAERLGLPVARKADSQEICFAPTGDYSGVIGERHPKALLAGEIVTLDGEIVGRHDGIARYTVGQRKGLGIGGAGDPLYVVAIDAGANRVVVGPRSALDVREVSASDVVWHGPAEADVAAMVRYRMPPVAAHAVVGGGTHASGEASAADAPDAATERRDAGAEPSADRLRVAFDEPLRGVAPGQSVVCYDGNRVLGGGFIEWAR